MSGTGMEVEGLSVGYRREDGGTSLVVWDVDLSLQPGTIFGLVGESGCGKSTTALAAIGYHAAGAQVLGGSSRLDDVELLSQPIERMRRIWGRRIGYVAQSASMALDPSMPVGAQLAEPLVRHLALDGEALRARQLELFSAVGLPDPAGALRRYPHQFSGGQQQRIAIAIAIACHPDVLILDEPTTGLDVTTQRRISRLLRSLVSDLGVAALYVSHDIALLAGVADEIAVMYGGQIVERAPAAELAQRPRHPYTRALVSAVPDIARPQFVTGIPGSPPPVARTEACPFAPRCLHAAEACRAGNPPLVATGPEQVARCIRLDELEEVLVRPAAVASRQGPAGDPLLQVERVSVAYGARHTRVVAVDDVSLEVAAGETVGIVGESGSGKSTLLRAIAGLHPQSAGTIRFAGRELAERAVKRPREVRRDLQLVFQNPDSSLNPRQTVEQIVARPIRLFRRGLSRAEEREEIRALLAAVKLPQAVLTRFPGELSGGQKQRVALARAFATRPRMLLCDEVTSALDVSVQATVLELIAQLSADFGTAVVFVSHDLAVVRTIAQRAVVMRSGQVCEVGATEQLFVAPEHPYTQSLVAAVPSLARSAEGGAPPAPAEAHDGA